jgi:hypothetical protein
MVSGFFPGTQSMLARLEAQLDGVPLPGFQMHAAQARQ